MCKFLTQILLSLERSLNNFAPRCDLHWLFYKGDSIKLKVRCCWEAILRCGFIQTEHGTHQKLTDIFTFLSFVTLFDRCVEWKALSMSFVLDNLRHLWEKSVLHRKSRECLTKSKNVLFKTIFKIYARHFLDLCVRCGFASFTQDKSTNEVSQILFPLLPTGRR